MPRLQLDTEMGTLLLEYGVSGITALTLPGDNLPTLETDEHDSGAEAGRENAEVASDLLQRYFERGVVDFSGVKVDLAGYSPFFRQICETVSKIGYGHILGYGEVALLAGMPKAARAVGRVMAKNPIPIIIPCHRVVASDGSLTGYSAAGGVGTKEMLLRMEGVKVENKKVV